MNLSLMKCTNGLIVIALLFSLAAVTGCAPSSVSPALSTSAATTNLVEQSPQPEVLPELRVLGFPSGETLRATYPAQLAEELTGYKVTYEGLPGDNPEEKLNLVFASGEAYDIVKIETANGKTIFYNFAIKGALMPLDDLIDQYGSNIKASLSEQTLSLSTVNDKLYGIDTKTRDRDIDYGLLVRQDWLDVLGIDQPTTLEGITDMLQAFREKDPGEMSSDNVIPLTNVGSVVDGIAGAFGVSQMWNLVDDNYVFMCEHPNFSDYVLYLKDLYDRKLFDNEFAVNKADTVNEKWINGVVGLVSTYWSNMDTRAQILEVIQDAKWDYLEAPIGPDGSRGYRRNVGYTSGGPSVIPLSAKNPEHAVKWMNMKLDPEIFPILVLGYEGEHYNIIDGDYFPINPKFNDELGGANSFFCGVDERIYGPLWLGRARKSDNVYNGWAKLRGWVGQFDVLDITQYIPVLPNVVKDQKVLEQMTTDFMTQIIAGAKDISQLESFLNEWREAGGEVCTNELNEWYAQSKDTIY